MDKTITVKTNRVMHHPVYNKLMRLATKFKVHDEKNTAKIGDVVSIEETRPLSKTKRWRLVEIIKKAGAGELQAAENEPKEKKAKSEEQV